MSDDTLDPIFTAKIEQISAALIEAESGWRPPLAIYGDLWDEARYEFGFESGHPVDSIGPFYRRIEPGWLSDKEQHWAELYGRFAWAKPETAFSVAAWLCRPGGPMQLLARRPEDHPIDASIKIENPELSGLLGQIREETSVERWDSNAGEAFRFNVLPKLETALSTQAQIIGALAELMELHGTYVRAVQDRALNIADATIKALGQEAEQNRQQAADRLKQLVTFGLKLTATLVTGGAAAPLAIEGFGTLLIDTVAAVDGSDGFEIVANMEQALEDLTAEVAKDQALFRDKLRALNDQYLWIQNRGVLDSSLYGAGYEAGGRDLVMPPMVQPYRDDLYTSDDGWQPSSD